jgi:hypothetical protein
MRVWKAALLVSGLAVGLLAACGEDSEDGVFGPASGGTGGGQTASGGSPPAGGTGGANASGGTGGSQVASGGAGGTGGAATLPPPVECAADSCTGYLILGQVAVAPCCVQGTNACGVDLGQLSGAGVVACVAVNQAGTADATCPDYNLQTLVPEAPLPLPFPGCCTPSGACGAQVNLTLLGGPNLGCVDAVEFGFTATPQACGGGAGGAGGTGGAGGAPAVGGVGGAVAGAAGSNN